MMKLNSNSNEYYTLLANRIREKSSSKRNMYLMNSKYFQGHNRLNLIMPRRIYVKGISKLINQRMGKYPSSHDKADGTTN